MAVNIETTSSGMSHCNLVDKLQQVLLGPAVDESSCLCEMVCNCQTTW